MLIDDQKWAFVIDFFMFMYRVVHADFDFLTPVGLRIQTSVVYLA